MNEFNECVHEVFSAAGDIIVALVVWCVYFMPIGILSFLHFHSGKR